MEISGEAAVEAEEEEHKQLPDMFYIDVESQVVGSLWRNLKLEESPKKMVGGPADDDDDDDD